MKLLILAVCALGCVSAADDQHAEVLRNDFSSSPDGSFQLNLETDNGIVSEAHGVLKTISKDEVALEVTGSNQYKNPDGETIQLTYIANENGYQPQGSHLPTPPPPVPIPDYIQKAIEYIEKHPYTEANA